MHVNLKRSKGTRLTPSIDHTLNGIKLLIYIIKLLFYSLENSLEKSSHVELLINIYYN